MKKLSCSRFGESAKHEGGSSKIDHGLGVAGFYFIVLGETSEVAEPSEGAFDDPALGQRHKAMGVDFLHDVGGEFAMSRQRSHPVGERPA